MDLQARMREDAALVEAALAGIFAHAEPIENIYEAMEYSLLAGGKRLRPVLSIEVCRLCGGAPEAVLPLACAVEMVHTYSLIHDDLPAMDNDDLRRGKPTNHKVFGEATAILAGDGLLTAAFETVAGAEHLSQSQRLQAVLALSKAAGAAGMIGGQTIDMAGETRALDRESVEKLQRLKTGALIRCAAHMGCIAANAAPAAAQAVDRYAEKLGLAFQVRDDILDVIATDETLGKPVGSDAASGKTTFVTLLGLEECQRWVDQLSREAAAALDGYENADFLQRLAAQLAGRDH